jgi:uncharacterized protein YggU (UPF0235/DUF167 family)
VRFTVRLTPRGGRDAITGWECGADGGQVLKARVAAPAVDNKANEALIALIARLLDVPKSSIRIAAGSAARRKIIEIAHGSATLADRLAALGET